MKKARTSPRSREDLIRQVRSLQSNLCITRKKLRTRVAILEEKLAIAAQRAELLRSQVRTAKREGRKAP